MKKENKIIDDSVNRDVIFKSASSVLNHYESNLPRWKKELEKLRTLVELDEEADNYNVASNNRSLLKH